MEHGRRKLHYKYGLAQRQVVRLLRYPTGHAELKAGTAATSPPGFQQGLEHKRHEGSDDKDHSAGPRGQVSWPRLWVNVFSSRRSGARGPEQILASMTSADATSCSCVNLMLMTAAPLCHTQHQTRAEYSDTASLL